MGFKACDEVMAGTTFFSLVNDKDAAHVLFVGEPIPREEDFHGKPRHRAYFPIVTAVGLQVWGIGSKLYRKLRDSWSDYNGTCYLVTRVGEAGSTGTVYGFKRTAVPAKLKANLKEATPKAIKDFLAEVQSFGEADGDGSDIPI